MFNIFLMKKMQKTPKNVSELFAEKGGYIKGKAEQEDIFYDPARLLEYCGLNNVLNNKPFRDIITPSRVWEFYLLRYSDKVNKINYKQLIKPIRKEEEAINKSNRTALGNPYDKWISNYHRIDDDDLRENSLPFVNKLVSRKCPIRQNGTPDFLKKRRQAAKSFFEYLIGGTITKNLFNELKASTGLQSKLAILINEYPNKDLFITSGLMTCLYGGKNIDSIDAKLVKAVLKALKAKRPPDNSMLKNVCNKISIKSSDKPFIPPYKNIYDIRCGNRERVNINFRIETWLKLLEDTFNASR